jgi:predicted RNA polymerase sigma factor
MAAIFRAAIPYLVPTRMEAELTVINLALNESYPATRGESRVRADLCAEGGPWRF